MIFQIILVLIVYVQESHCWNSYVKSGNILRKSRLRLKPESSDKESKLTVIDDSIMATNITSTRFRGAFSQESMLRQAQRLRQEAEELEVEFSKS